MGGKGEGSCGKSGRDETPQERTRRGGSSAARGNQLQCHKLMHPFVRLSTGFISLYLNLIF
ncbi:hypothetical protein [Priestia aryabhattai]|uniref:hypothetical protein n=1 Tax=Priestia aryabhattai TaxID=412384 RepID=UPI0031016B4D